MISGLLVAGCGGGGSGSSPTTPVVPPVAPSITDQPRDVSVVSGDTATFLVSAEGTEPLSYQWRRDGVGIPGANSSAYTTPILAAGDDALFSVIVSNGVGSVTSQNAQLSVLTSTVSVDSTSITVDATDLTVDTL